MRDYATDKRTSGNFTPSGVENILVVLNKCDLVDEEWLKMIEQQICEEMQQLFTVGQRNDQVEDKLEYNVDIVRVSAKSGAGIEELRSQILKCVKSRRKCGKFLHFQDFLWTEYFQ